MSEEKELIKLPCRTARRIRCPVAREPSAEAMAVAKRMVAQWEHGSDEHRRWLRDMCVPDVARALDAFADAAVAQWKRLDALRNKQLRHARRGDPKK